MRNNTDHTDRKKRGAVASAAVVTGALLLVVLTVGAGILGAGSAGLLAGAILGFYALLGLAVVVGILAALRQRLREIQGGEEEDARKY